ncbi:universal stress protein [Streptomyces sp. A7024]|uniref:Universal stress protein n=1 Tax=Streptomyces coryli TaxID=1128680 RepID=A0A6G4TTZ4_9ACTN|nr:universal stress protein [Streptomyces coryli]
MPVRDKLPVVVGVDGSAAGIRAVEWGVDEAYRRTWRLHLVHVPPGRGSVARAAGRQLLEGAAQVAHARRSLVDITSDVLPGPVASTLIDAATQGSILAVGARGNSHDPGLLLGSTARQAVAGARGPVVVVRDEPPGHRFGVPRVAVGIAGTEPSTAAVDFAIRAAELRHAELGAVHAWEPALVPAYPAPGSPGDGWAEGIARAHEVIKGVFGARAQDALTVRAEPVPGTAWSALLQASTEAELLVLGRGSGTEPPVLGPTLRVVLRRAQCPVAVVPG